MARPAISGYLQALADKNRGRLTPEMVLAAARDKASPIHDRFNWNDREAAHQNRLDTARHLIRTVRIEVTTTRFTMRAPVFLRDPRLPGNEQGYVTLGKLATDEELAREVLVTECGRIAASMARLQAVAHATGLQNEIEQLRTQVEMLANQAHQEGTA